MVMTVAHLISPDPLHVDPPCAAHGVHGGQGEVAGERERLPGDRDGSVGCVRRAHVALHPRERVGRIHAARTVELDLLVHPCVPDTRFLPQPVGELPHVARLEIPRVQPAVAVHHGDRILPFHRGAQDHRAGVSLGPQGHAVGKAAGELERLDARHVDPLAAAGGAHPQGGLGDRRACSA